MRGQSALKYVRGVSVFRMPCACCITDCACSRKNNCGGRSKDNILHSVAIDTMLLLYCMRNSTERGKEILKCTVSKTKRGSLPSISMLDW